LDIFTSDTYIEKFEAETVEICGAMIKRHDEITKVEALERKYRDGKVPMINYKTNKNEYMCVALLLFYHLQLSHLDRTGWICDAVNVASIATFDYDHSPIIIANIKPLSRRSKKVGSKFGVYKFLVFSEFKLVTTCFYFLNIISRFSMFQSLYLHSRKQWG
jgi:hypothetical protein